VQPRAPQPRLHTPSDNNKNISIQEHNNPIHHHHLTTTTSKTPPIMFSLPNLAPRDVRFLIPNPNFTPTNTPPVPQHLVQLLPTPTHPLITRLRRDARTRSQQRNRHRNQRRRNRGRERLDPGRAPNPPTLSKLPSHTPRASPNG
jgi:hypothetical protein